jgi:hypothetical protein
MMGETLHLLAFVAQSEQQVDVVWRLKTDRPGYLTASGER